MATLTAEQIEQKKQQLKQLAEEVKQLPDELADAIEKAPVSNPICPVYQNVDARPHTDAAEIKANLLKQLTSPVRWTQSVKNMVADGMTEFVECGPGQVLTGLIGRIQKSLEQ